MKGRRMLPETGASASPLLTVPPAPFEDPVLDELSRKMLAWSRVWFGSESRDGTAVRERLLYWLTRCIGGKAGTVLTDRAEDLSLAMSTPLLTAFLGRRAMVELSRRVLNDS